MSKSIKVSPQKIKEFRIQEGFSQQDLAQILNVGVSTISRWENAEGEVTISGTTAAVMGVCLGYTSAKINDNLEDLGKVMLSACSYEIYRRLKEVFEPDTNPK